MLKFIAENWFIIFTALCIIYTVVRTIIDLIKTKQLLPKIQEWLLYAVIEAEKQLGSGTGEAKLHLVYDMMITKFPTAAIFISFEQFTKMVDIALEKLESMLKDNQNLKDYIDM